MVISAGSTPKARPPRQQPLGGGADAEASTPVFLNVYDVTPANGYARWLGLGVYHSGVQGTSPSGPVSFYFPPRRAA
jgi:deubiquitinase DESI2